MSKDEQSRSGKFLGIPYDWSKPTKERFRARVWNPDEPRFFTPRAFGWGYDLNFYRVIHPRKRPTPKP